MLQIAVCARVSVYLEIHICIAAAPQKFHFPLLSEQIASLPSQTFPTQCIGSEIQQTPEPHQI